MHKIMPQTNRRNILMLADCKLERHLQFNVIRNSFEYLRMRSAIFDLNTSRSPPCFDFEIAETFKKTMQIQYFNQTRDKNVDAFISSY